MKGEEGERGKSASEWRKREGWEEREREAEKGHKKRLFLFLSN